MRTTNVNKRVARKLVAPAVLIASTLVLSACGGSAERVTSPAGDAADAASPTSAPIAGPGSTVPGSTAPPTTAGDPAGSPVAEAVDEDPGAASPDDGRGAPRDLRKACAPARVAALPASITCRTVMVDGYAREYLAYVPKAVAASADPVPAVLMFHGSTGTMEQFARVSGWREKADAEGFVVGFTQGLQYFVTDDGANRWSTKFNTYSLPGEIDATKRLPGYPADAPWPADDVAYTDAVLDDLATVHPVDQDRQYVSGFSNGSAMAHRIGVELDERVAAVTGSSGFLGQARPDDFADQAATVAPAWFSLGSKDDRVTVPAGVAELPMAPEEILANKVLTAVVGGAVAGWSLPSEPCSTDTTAHTTTFRWCADGQPEYRFTMIDDMTHTYPHGQQGSTNPNRVSMIDDFWSFMVDHPHA